MDAETTADPARDGEVACGWNAPMLHDPRDGCLVDPNAVGPCAPAYCTVALARLTGTRDRARDTALLGRAERYGAELDSRPRLRVAVVVLAWLAAAVAVAAVTWYALASPGSGDQPATPAATVAPHPGGPVRLTPDPPHFAAPARAL